MHYGIVAIGSRGDVQPFIAVALGLMQHGHRVTLMAHENFDEFVTGHGVTFYPLTGDIEALLYTPEGQQALRSGNVITFIRYLRKSALGTRAAFNADLLAGSRSADVLVTSTLGVAWIGSIAEKLQKKWAIIHLSFPITPTTAFPFAGLDFFDFPPYNLFSYRLVRQIFWRFNKKEINGFRGSLGLDPMKKSIGDQTADEQVLNLYAFSPALLSRPRDWTANVDITGFMTLPVTAREGHDTDKIPDELEARRTDKIPDGLEAWLNAGEKPVYIGFGSIPIADPESFCSLLTAILAANRHRIIFCQGWSILTTLPDHPNLFVVKSINHEWLLPHCKAAVFHGGIGTLGAILRAGIPVVIASVFADQPWWGKLIAGKKIGVHLPSRKLMASIRGPHSSAGRAAAKLLAAIDLACSPERADKVKKISVALRGEDGVRVAVEKLEKYFA